MGYNRRMGVPKFLQPYLPSYDLSKLDLLQNKETIITSVLNLGDKTAVRWVFRNYPVSDIKGVVRQPRRGMWMRKSLSYWQNILGLRIEKMSFELGVMDFRPRPELYERFFRLGPSSRSAH